MKLRDGLEVRILGLLQILGCRLRQPFFISINLELRRIYSYILRFDTGAASNPFWQICTFTICRPKDEQHELEIGLSEQNQRIQNLRMEKNRRCRATLSREPTTFNFCILTGLPKIRGDFQFFELAKGEVPTRATTHSRERYS